MAGNGTDFFNKNGYNAETLKQFENTIQDILHIKPDLVLLDINLPYTDGEFVCRELRKQSNVPITFNNTLNIWNNICINNDVWISKCTRFITISCSNSFNYGSNIWSIFYSNICRKQNNNKRRKLKNIKY